MNIAEKARLFAFAAHNAIGHRRKYTGEPYTEHLVEVEAIVRKAGGSDAMRAAAWLHDVIEDTQVSEELLMQEFPSRVVEYVMGLTDVSTPDDGNRATRKRLDAMHIARQDPEVQTIKYADLISNTASIVQHDPAFAKVYLREKRELLSLAHKGDATLFKRAWKLAHMMGD